MSPLHASNHTSTVVEVMNDKYLAWGLFGLTGLLYLLGVAAFISMLQAMLIRDTVTAIESAFGSFVLMIMLFLLARRTREAAKRKIQQANNFSTDSAGKP